MHPFGWRLSHSVLRWRAVLTGWQPLERVSMQTNSPVVSLNQHSRAAGLPYIVRPLHAPLLGPSQAAPGACCCRRAGARARNSPPSGERQIKLTSRPSRPPCRAASRDYPSLLALLAADAPPPAPPPRPRRRRRRRLRLALLAQRGKHGQTTRRALRLRRRQGRLPGRAARACCRRGSRHERQLGGQQAAAGGEGGTGEAGRPRGG